MPEIRYPGVYIEEMPVWRPVEGVSTTTAAFIGFAPAGKAGVPVEVVSWQGFCSEFVPASRKLHLVPAYMPRAVKGYFENGGRKAIILRLDEASAGPAEYAREIAILDSIPDVSMVVTPETQDEQVVQAVLAHVAERKQAVYLFDAPARMGLREVREFARRFDSDYGALYYPWLIADGRSIPSAGHVAGVIARTELTRGIYKAPAGTEAVVLGISGTSQTASAGERGRLRDAHVNWIGCLPGFPIALQGIRTAGESYLHLRRALIYLERSLASGLRQLSFERSERATWAKAAQLAEDFLHSEYAKGGLLGSKPQEAYFVKCDAETNTSSDIERGRVLLLAGVALIRPAEFLTMLIAFQTQA